MDLVMTHLSPSAHWTGLVGSPGQRCKFRGQRLECSMLPPTQSCFQAGASPSCWSGVVPVPHRARRRAPQHASWLPALCCSPHVGSSERRLSTPVLPTRGGEALSSSKTILPADITECLLRARDLEGPVSHGHNSSVFFFIPTFRLHKSCTLSGQFRVGSNRPGTSRSQQSSQQLQSTPFPTEGQSWVLSGQTWNCNNKARVVNPIGKKGTGTISREVGTAFDVL